MSCSRSGQELYRRLATLGTHAAKMGRSLHATVESYNQFVGALESRVLVTARRMQELDARHRRPARPRAGRDRPARPHRRRAARGRGRRGRASRAAPRRALTDSERRVRLASRMSFASRVDPAREERPGCASRSLTGRLGLSAASRPRRTSRRGASCRTAGGLEVAADLVGQREHQRLLGGHDRA